jgi:DNA-binding NtrC family response regulator
LTLDAREGPTLVHYRDGDKPMLVLRSAVARIIAGPGQGLSAPIGLSPIVIGAGSDCDISVPDPKVSRHHLELRVHTEGYLLRDLDSTNGTHYRGARVQDVLLGPGAEVRLGETVVRIERGEELTSPVAPQAAFGSLIGTSRAMQDVFGLLAAVAPTESTVLILGETGTGKELVAEELHSNSHRRDQPFSVLDCGAVPEQLLESELFGHKRGAFTGADSDRAGIFEQANGGTVFLDEIGELPQPQQTRLLRVLEQRSIKRLGENTRREVDVRIVAATHRDLPQRVKAGDFRQDLFYRLSVVQLRLPPLRERREDIPQLVQHFLQRSGVGSPESVLGPAVLEALVARKWRGNIRELRNVVERAIVLADTGLPLLFDESDTDIEAARSAAPITPALDVGSAAAAALGESPAAPAPEVPGALAALDKSWLARAMPEGFLDRPYKLAKEVLLEQFESEYLRHLLKKHGYNITHLAQAAKIDRHLVRKLLRKHGLAR